MSRAFWNPAPDEGPSSDIKELATSHRFRSVLDAGCGTGRNLIPFAIPGCTVYGIDINPDAVSTARKRLIRRTADAVKIEVADLLSHVPNRQFDLVICYGVLHFLLKSDRIQAYRRIGSWVAPNGLISIVMFNKNVPIPTDLAEIMPEPAENSDELRSAFPEWNDVRFRSYIYQDEHDGGRVRHTHSIDRLIAQAAGNPHRSSSTIR